MKSSRTSNSLKNALTALLFYILQVVLGFWSRKVFYATLGSEILGLDQTANSLLGFLNLAELGVSTSVGYFLYKPIFDNDKRSISEIVTVQGYIYRRVAMVILVGSTLLMCFFPVIFKDMSVPLWYAYVIFSGLLFSSLIGYYVNYKICVLNAAQKAYKVTRASSGFRSLLKLFLIFTLPLVSQPFLLYIIANFCGVVIGAIILNYVIKVEYPWLSIAVNNGRDLLTKYNGVISKTKQLFVHKISSYVIIESQPLLLFAYSSLTTVAYFGNYLSVIGSIRVMLSTTFDGSQASIGNLIAEGNIEKIKSVFWETFDLRFCMASIVMVSLYYITPPFISIWLSKSYLLGETILILVLVQSWFSIVRTTLDNFVSGYGLFQDTWAPIAEVVIFLLGVCVLGHLYEIQGVLLSGLISSVLIIGIWRPLFLFKKGFKENVLSDFFFPLAKRVMITGVVILILNRWMHFTTPDSYATILIYALKIFSIVFATMYTLFILISKGIRTFNNRIIHLIIKQNRSV